VGRARERSHPHRPFQRSVARLSISSADGTIVVSRAARDHERQPTVPIPLRLLAHLRRWHRIDPEPKHFVEFNGKPVNSVKTAFKSAVRLAGLGPGISPHTLRHTAATWLMQKGADGRRSKVVQQPLDQGIPGVANCIASISKKLE